MSLRISDILMPNINFKYYLKATKDTWYVHSTGKDITALNKEYWPITLTKIEDKKYCFFDHPNGDKSRCRLDEFDSYLTPVLIQENYLPKKPIGRHLPKKPIGRLGLIIFNDQ